MDSLESRKEDLGLFQCRMFYFSQCEKNMIDEILYDDNTGARRKISSS